MPPSVKFKEPGSMIRTSHGAITEGNLTYEKYQWLLSQNESYASQFIVHDAEPAAQVSKKSTNSKSE